MMQLEVKDGEFVFSGRSFNITEEKNRLLASYGKMLLSYGKVLYLLPSIEQIDELNQQIGNSRLVRNLYLEERDRVYRDERRTLSVSEYKKEYFSRLKEIYPFLEKSDKFALESAVERVETAYQKFFDNLKKGKPPGFPKMASKYKPNGNSYTTKFTNNNIRLELIDGVPFIKIPKVGYIRFVLPVGESMETILPKDTHITKATIKRSGKDYTISLQLETIVDIPEKMISVNVKDICSMDMGIKHFAIYGNKENTKVIENPRWIQMHEKRIRRLGQSLSRKVKGSKNYEKAKQKLAKEHHKIKNQRKDFHHKESRKIADTYDVFVCEDLSVKGMVRNGHLSKKISSVGWSSFLTLVKYKMERKGKLFIKVNRFYPSSKLCSKCGQKNDTLTLKDREWICPHCHTLHNRDENAKNNILKEGIRILKEEQGIVVLG